MKALLMHRDRDFDIHRPLPRHERALTQDLELETLLHAMAGDDKFLFEVARAALFSGFGSDIETIVHRQRILGDCLSNPEVVRELYDLTVETLERKRKDYWWGWSSRHPGAVLSSAVHLMELFVEMLREVRGLVDRSAASLQSPGMSSLIATLQRELADDYFATIENHLADLRFRSGVLVSAELGEGNKGANYVLREERDKRPRWLKWLLGTTPSGFTYTVPERDEAGARALTELRDRGIDLVANALAQAADHILGFFMMLRTELAFYVACLNLHDRLAAIGAPIAFPQPQPTGSRVYRASGLYDICLSLTMNRPIVGNDIAADGKDIAIITGANQGGKSTFLRAAGLAQLMMQCGMFVSADSLTAELCTSVYTHYKREEDVRMEHGKLDEELARMSEIADAIEPHALVLFNESFASTNEVEGSEIARQVATALVDERIKVLFVTHLQQFARRWFDAGAEGALFLRAERLPDGTRSFRIIEGEPLETSFGADLYAEVFEGASLSTTPSSVPE